MKDIKNMENCEGVRQYMAALNVKSANFLKN